MHRNDGTPKEKDKTQEEKKHTSEKTFYPIPHDLFHNFYFQVSPTLFSPAPPLTQPTPSQKNSEPPGRKGKLLTEEQKRRRNEKAKKKVWVDGNNNIIKNPKDEEKEYLEEVHRTTVSKRKNKPQMMTVTNKKGAEESVRKTTVYLRDRRQQSLLVQPNTNKVVSQNHQGSKEKITYAELYKRNERIKKRKAEEEIEKQGYKKMKPSFFKPGVKKSQQDKEKINQPHLQLG